MMQILILVAFWMSYLAMTCAAMIIIVNFVASVQRRRHAQKPPVEQESVKLHISEGLIEVNRLPQEEQDTSS